MYLDRGTTAQEVPTDPAGPLARIEAMSAEECLRAYRTGRLTRSERTAWAAAYPEEVPIVNGELESIALAIAGGCGE